MDKNSAINLLDETFNNDFEMGRFSFFIKELLNGFRLNLRDLTKYVPNEYIKFVNSFYSLGTYIDDSKNTIEVFSVGLERTSSRDRARSMQRNLIANFLEKFRNHASLVAFYGDDPKDWRFSFVKMDYELVEEGEKVEVRKKITPAKRYSYLVGVNEPNHTCKDQFLDLLMNEDIKPTLNQIEAAFSIEKVTKEFFTEYKKLFLDLKESLKEVIDNDLRIKKEFKDKNISTTDFAKKLLGQIVFIYFLQKKGWLGVKKQKSWGSGPKKFLRELFDGEMASYDNFFNEILEPLFYEALATERDGDYYSRFNCRIPFLNGGLFEPINDYNWFETDITLDNEIFKEILKTFDLFNFTVKEDEPLEKEVAVDPEMLGKVFENLLEVTDRKSKGAFYTPREIVHYMCQQSLVNYLETHIHNIVKTDIEQFILKGDLALDSIIREQEQKSTYHGQIFDKQLLPESIKENSEIINKLLKNIKVVDPAVGSGAFPVGMMNEIVRARYIISLLSEKEINNYDLKRETIENSLYGVDIDSSSVDITKLRFWLSLVVDEENIENIKPLPNLDHKIMCGNSLIEEFEGINLFDENLLEVPETNTELERITAEKTHLEKQLGQLRKDSANNIDEITEIDNQISKLRRKIKKIVSKTNTNSQSSLFASEAQIKLKKLKKIHEQFFNAESPNKKKKLRQEIDLIEWEFIEETLKNQGNERTIIKLDDYKRNKSKPFFLWKLYFSEVFQRENPGFDVVIANPPYGIVYDEDYKLLYENKFPSFKRNNDIYIAFYENSLYLARENGTTSFITPNTFLNGDYFKIWRKTLTNSAIISEIRDFKNIPIFDDPTVFVAVLNYIKSDEIDYPYSFKMKNSKDSLKDFDIEIVEIEKGSEKRIKATNPLFKKILSQNKVDIVDNLFFVKDVGFNYWTKGRGKKRGGNSIGKRVLYKGNKLNSNDIPFLKGRDITKYHIKKPENYLKHNYTDFLDDEVDTFRFSADFLEKSPKVIYRQTSNKIIAALDFNSYYLDKTVHLIVHKDDDEKYDLKYLLSLLNSNLYNYLYEFISQEMAGRTFAQVKTTYIKQLPLKKLSEKDQEPFIQLVNKILEYSKEVDYLENENKRKNVKELEKDIDRLIYSTYNLTENEILEVEKFNLER